jgi:hypothetical protein
MGHILNFENIILKPAAAARHMAVEHPNARNVSLSLRSANVM